MAEEHVIYVIGELENPTSVKVGYTGRKPSRRVGQLRKSTGRNLALLAAFPVNGGLMHAAQVEQRAHKLLRCFWTGRGEWFACSPEMASAAVKGALPI